MRILNFKQFFTSFMLFLIAFCVVFPAFAEKKQKVIELKDDANRPFFLTEMPKRIISLAPEITEIIFEVGCGNKLVAVSNDSAFPAKARNFPKAGSLEDPQLAEIFRKKPDLVIVTAKGETEHVADKLRSMGVPVYTYFPRTLEQIFSSLKQLGRVMDCQQMSSYVTNQYQLVTSKRPKKNLKNPARIAFVLGSGPYYVAGKNTLANQMIEWVGAKNAFTDFTENYSKISKDVLINADPDIIIVSGTGPKSRQKNMRHIANLPLKASKNSMIIDIESRHFVNPGIGIFSTISKLSDLITKLEHKEDKTQK